MMERREVIAGGVGIAGLAATGSLLAQPAASLSAKPIELDGYKVTDAFFGRPFIDADEQRGEGTLYRYIHGGFEGTDTRFTYCFPSTEHYRGRLFQPLEGANAGHENVNAGPLGPITGGLEMTFRLGGYCVESNMGHIGDVEDPKAGPDPTIYGFRAAAESARFSKYVARQIYGEAPHHAYVYGGSGGARRSPLCLAYGEGTWDAALPYMGDAMDGEHGDMRRLRTGTPNFSSMFNVQRVLGAKLLDVIDAMQPGGSGNPFAGLDTHQAEELATLYRLGYPRGDEFMIMQPMGQAWLWASMAERLEAEDPYFKSFWTEPGHVGHDQPDLVRKDIINLKTRIKRPLFARQLAEEAEFRAPEYARVVALASVFAGMENMWDVPMAVELEQDPGGYPQGAGIKFLSGKATGRQLYYMSGVRTVWLGAGAGEAQNLRFKGVQAGDEVQLDNRAFLAYCYYYRHHIMNHVEWDALRIGGKPIYKQYRQPEASPFMGVLHTGRFEGKMMWVHHTHDASLWPVQGVGMKNNVEREYGAVEARKKFRLRWTENAEHVPPHMAASAPGRANTTWLIDYQPVIEQCLLDLVDWVENDIEPIDSNFSLVDGQITLPPTARERGGIQPVVSVTADGGVRADVRVGESVALIVKAEVPEGTGKIIGVKWDFDGTGSYPREEVVDGTRTALMLSTSHSFDRPGTYFVTALVESHREGEVNAKFRRVSNVASARVVVS